MKKRHLVMIVLALFSCAIFGQNEIQEKLIGNWQHIDAKGRTHTLEVNANTWKHSRPSIFRRIPEIYSGDYKFIKAKKIIIIYNKDMKGNDLKKTVKIKELDNNILIIKLIEKKWPMGKNRIIYSFKRV
ncbi:MAG: hypothetical protein K8R41_05760 [Bacteroidales bacterium]|nr:hypothetical protein [Bacteroidales bacterium]